MNGVLRTLLGWLFPESMTCDICGGEVFDDSRLCVRCKKLVEFNDGLTCPICGRKSVSNQICFECKADAPAYKKGVSALVYNDGAVMLIRKFKDDYGYLKEHFAPLLAEKCTVFSDAQAICYVPMTQKDEFKRGYNQAELLAKAVGERLHLPVIDDAIIKIKQTKEQKNLTKRERMDNLVGAFKADKNKVKDKVLILIDDVLTTGATANAVTKKLLQAGAKTVYFASAASVEYKRPI
jgi:ComF family protein